MERGNNTLVRVCMIAFGQRWVNRAIARLKNRLAQALVRTALQEVLEAEMTEALGAEKRERTAGRLGT